MYKTSLKRTHIRIISYYAEFYQCLHFLLRQKWSSVKEIQLFLNKEVNLYLEALLEALGILP